MRDTCASGPGSSDEFDVMGVILDRERHVRHNWIDVVRDKPADHP
jgi:hypothetical protein